MKKFSNLDKTDLNDNEPKTFDETLKALVEDTLSINVSGDNAELAGQLNLSIDGKDELIQVVEKLTNVFILKESIKILNSFKAKTAKNNSLNWVDAEIDTINESIEKIINGEIDITKFKINESLINKK